MSEEKKYHHYTAADIEKYHKGLLSSGEMHELEKAALDDPFLADALEGYGAVSITASADLAELEKKLAERVTRPDVVTMSAPKTPFLWWKAAAAVIILGGIGFLTYRLSTFNKSENPVAIVPEKKSSELQSTTGADTSGIKTGLIKDSTTNDYAILNNGNTVLKPIKADSGQYLNLNTRSSFSNFDSSVTNDVAVVTQPKSPVERKDLPDAELKQKSLRNDNVADKGTISEKANEGYVLQEKNKKAQQPDTFAFGDYKTRGAISKTKDNYSVHNYFRGKVIDPNKNPLPFANVTNTRDNVGTYADAQGNFTLISRDTVLNVQIRSIGFEDNNTQLKNNVPTNQVVLQEDKSLNQTVISNRAFNTNRSRDANIKLEEPEPADGWSNYDTYLANNIVVPTDIKIKQVSGEVELSFEVDKNGNPVNIKVEKSLCNSCDQEAIRLVKQGPKWKRKGKKSHRVTVAVPFTE